MCAQEDDVIMQEVTLHYCIIQMCHIKEEMSAGQVLNVLSDQLVSELVDFKS